MELLRRARPLAAVANHPSISEVDPRTSDFALKLAASLK